MTAGEIALAQFIVSGDAEGSYRSYTEVLGGKTIRSGAASARRQHPS
jgi:hypothetical protein